MIVAVQTFLDVLTGPLAERRRCSSPSRRFRPHYRLTVAIITPSAVQIRLWRMVLSVTLSYIHRLSHIHRPVSSGRHSEEEHSRWIQTSRLFCVGTVAEGG